MSFFGDTKTDFLKLPKVDDAVKANLIDYSVTDFYSIRNKIITYINATYPNDFTNFDESDFGIMFAEVVAYMGAVLAHKADMLANESFVGTVKTRANLAKLLELIGYRMKGPSSAVGSAKITLPSPGVGPYTIGIGSRVVTIKSQLDSSPVTYTIYKLDNGVIKNIEDLGGTDIVFSGQTQSSTYFDFALVEGSIAFEEGEFSDADSLKRVELSKSPVIEGSIGVYVSDPNNTNANGVYKEVKKMFFASGSDDKVFSVDTDEQFNTAVQFGDNIFGVSPGKNSTFKIVYRVGGGPRGNLDKEALNTNISIVSGTGTNIIGTIENTTNITGGTNSESMVRAKYFAALDFRRQNRVVTLEDYIAFANTLTLPQGAIGRATAAVRRASGTANIIDVYILEKANDHQLQRATTSTKSFMLEEFEKVKMLTDHVVICDGLIRTLDLNITVKVDKENAPLKDSIKLSVANKILSYFSVDRFAFGEAFIPDDLNRTIFQTNYVRFSTIDNVLGSVPVDFNEIIQLNNFTINVVEV